MVIGMDVGGTTARIRVTDANGSVLWEEEDQGGTLAGIGGAAGQNHPAGPGSFRHHGR